jgi:DHA1 family multidrug resistance protein-like MFS transporter
MVAFTLLHLGQSLAPNMTTLLVTRFLAGFFGAAPLSNCAGTSSPYSYHSVRSQEFFLAVIFDIWPVVGRGAATAIIITSVFFGTAVGPVLGSL